MPCWATCFLRTLFLYTSSVRDIPQTLMDLLADWTRVKTALR